MCSGIYYCNLRSNDPALKPDNSIVWSIPWWVGTLRSYSCDVSLVYSELREDMRSDWEKNNNFWKLSVNEQINVIKNEYYLEKYKIKHKNSSSSNNK